MLSLAPMLQTTATLISRQSSGPSQELVLHAPELVRQLAPGQAVLVKAGPGLDPYLRRTFYPVALDAETWTLRLPPSADWGAAWLRTAPLGLEIDCLGRFAMLLSVAAGVRNCRASGRAIQWSPCRCWLGRVVDWLTSRPAHSPHATVCRRRACLHAVEYHLVIRRCQDPAARCLHPVGPAAYDAVCGGQRGVLRAAGGNGQGRTLRADALGRCSIRDICVDGRASRAADGRRPSAGVSAWAGVRPDGWWQDERRTGATTSWAEPGSADKGSGARRRGMAAGHRAGTFGARRRPSPAAVAATTAAAGCIPGGFIRDQRPQPGLRRLLRDDVAGCPAGIPAIVALRPPPEDWDRLAATLRTGPRPGWLHLPAQVTPRDAGWTANVRRLASFRCCQAARPRQNCCRGA